LFFVFLIATLPLWVFWVTLFRKRKEYSRSAEVLPAPILLDTKAEGWWFGNTKLQAKVLTVQFAWAVSVGGIFLLISGVATPSDTFAYFVAAIPIWVWASIYLVKLRLHYLDTGNWQSWLEYNPVTGGWWFGNGKLQIKVVCLQIVWALVVIGTQNLPRATA
jgi:hypothetical protein